jgi:hypothetical protein
MTAAVLLMSSAVTTNASAVQRTIWALPSASMIPDRVKEKPYPDACLPIICRMDGPGACRRTPMA